MYCQCCGIYNSDDSNVCQICNATLESKEETDSKVFVDLTLVPFSAIVKSLQGVNPFRLILYVPIITIIYFFKKITRKTLITPFLNSRSPKLQIVSLEKIKKVHKKSFQKVLSFFTQNGFEPLIDMEAFDSTHETLRRIMMNSAKNIYGIIHIGGVTGKVSHVTFCAVTEKKTYIEINNTYGFPITYPKNCIVRFPQNHSPEQAYQELLGILDEIKEKPLALSLKQLLQVSYKVHLFSVDQSVREGIFIIKDKDTDAKSDIHKKVSDVSTCYFHPFNIAVRKCNKCNMMLCEACYTLRGDAYYCEKCLPAETEDMEMPGIRIAGQTIAVPEGFKFAGFGVRTLATFVDLLIICLLTFGIGFALNYGMKILMPETTGALHILVAQLFFVSFSVFYLIVPIHKFGFTPGQKLLGLRIIDRKGNIPDTVSSVVRFAYHLFASLFVVPILGYFFILFRKTRQGLHDQLAETFVITKPSLIKTLFSWLMMLGMCGGIGWFGSQWVMPFFLGGGGFTPKITLEQRWEYPPPESSETKWSHVIYKDQCIVSTDKSLCSLDMRTGNIAWKADDLGSSEIRINNDNLFLLKKQENTLIKVNPESGAVLWKQSLEIKGPIMISDEASVVLYSDKTICEYDVNGKLLWKKDFQDNLSIDYAILNKHILITISSESDNKSGKESLPDMIYIARNTGNILWEKKKSKYRNRNNLTNGYQSFYGDGKEFVMYLPEQKVLYELPTGNYTMAYNDKTKNNGKNIPPIIYTITSAIQGEDGKILFAYPAGMKLLDITNDSLILIPANRKNISQKSLGNILFVDKLTGEVKKSFEKKEWTFISYLTEDQENIYLLKRIMKSKTLQSELLIIHKESFALQEIPIGKNLVHLSDFKVFSQEKLVFIATYQNIGGYVLPDF